MYLCSSWRILRVLLLLCHAAHTSAQACPAGYIGGNFIGQYTSTSACSRFFALMTWKTSFASVATRGYTAVGTLPTYSSTGGPASKGSVSFVRSSLQYIDGGARSFSPNTNGGFTIVTVLRFTGTAVNFEVILQLRSATAWGTELLFSRMSSDASVQVALYNTYGNIKYLATGLTIAQNTWYRISVFYTAWDKVIIIKATNTVTVSAGALEAYTDKTLSNTLVGKSENTAQYFNGDMAGVFMIDELLSTTAVSAIQDYMENGVDMTSTACPSGSACTSCGSEVSPTATATSTVCACNAGFSGYDAANGSCTVCTTGKYKSGTGSEACSTCPAGSTSPVASVASTACVALSLCNAGYTGPDGGPCSACVAGTYKNTTGSGQCLGCPGETDSGGTYSASMGATLCTTCPPNSVSANTSSSTFCICIKGYAP